MEMKDLAKAIEDRDTETIKKLAAIEAKGEVLDARLFEIEQKTARSGGGDYVGEHTKTIGGRFTDDDQVKSALTHLASTTQGKVALNVKTTITSATSDAAGSAGAGIAPQRADLVPLQQQTLTMRSVIPSVQMTSASVEYPAQKARTNNAGMVAEGASKPESDIQLELKTATAKVIAHWTKASRQVLDDVPQLRELIDSELIYGLKVKEDAQILQGDGTGQNLLGLIPQATAFAAQVTGVVSPQNIDVLGQALLQVTMAEFVPDAVVMHPSEWLRIRLLKDADGNYIFGDPEVQQVPRIFGVPIVPTLGMATGKFLAGSFGQAATIFDRWDARVEVGFVNDDFTRNLVTLLGEERLALAVKRPLAMVYGDFTAAKTAIA